MFVPWAMASESYIEILDTDRLMTPTCMIAKLNRIDEVDFEAQNLKSRDTIVTSVNAIAVEHCLRSLAKERRLSGCQRIPARHGSEWTIRDQSQPLLFASHQNICK